MRYIKHLPLAALALSFIFATGCKKDKKDDSPGPSGSSAPVTCKVNGNAWNSVGQDDKVMMLGDTANGVDAAFEEDTLGFSAISVKGTDTTAILFSCTVDKDRIGSYSLDPSAGGFGMYTPGVDFNTFLATAMTYGEYTTGSLNITAYDAAKQTISGTFSISMDHPDAGQPDYIVTEGSFKDIKLR